MRPTSLGCAAWLGRLMWLGLLAASVAGLIALDRGPLALPSLGHPDQLAHWWADAGPLLCTFALLRVVTLAIALYLMAMTAAGLLATATRWRGLGRVVDWLAVPGARWLLQGALSVSLATTAAASATTTPAASAASAGAIVGEPPVTGSSPPMLHRVDTGAPEPARTPRLPAPATPIPPTPPPPPRTWTVRPGDSLWSVSKTVLQHAWGRPVTDREVGTFWVVVVEANRDRLPDPANADLLHPGALLVVPTPPTNG